MRNDEVSGIQKLSVAFVKLLDKSKFSTQEDAEVLDWKDVNPIFVLTSSGLTIRFVKEPKYSDTVHRVKKHFDNWNFLTDFANGVFEKKLKDLKVDDVIGNSDDLPLPDISSSSSSSSTGGNRKEFENFLFTIWKIMKISVNYAENNFYRWSNTNSAATTTTTTTPEVDENAEVGRSNEDSSLSSSSSSSPSESLSLSSETSLPLTSVVRTENEEEEQRNDKIIPR